MKKAVIIGASSGMGREMAKIYSERGYDVGLAARRMELLEELADELKTRTWIKQMDIADTSNAISAFEELLSEMGGADVIILNAALGLYNPELDWEREEKQLTVNVVGFAAVAGVAYKHLRERGSGKLAGLSSLAALRGMPGSESYASSKAFVSNYLEGLRMRAFHDKVNVTVTDVRPGFVDTPMTESQKGMFWVAPTHKAALQIVDAVEKGKSIVYITRRWRLVAPFMRNMPDFLYKKVLGIEKEN